MFNFFDSKKVRKHVSDLWPFPGGCFPQINGKQHLVISMSLSKKAMGRHTINPQFFADAKQPVCIWEMKSWELCHFY